MGMLDTLFGGGGGDIPPTSKLRNADITPDAFKVLRPQIANLVSGATTGTAPLTVAGVPAAPQPYAAPMTAAEGDLLSRLFGRSGEPVGRASFDDVLKQFAGGGTGLQGANEAEIMKTLGGSYLDPSTNPWLAKSIESAIAPLRSEWQNEIMPNLRIGFTQAGQTITPFGSSPFDRAAALAGNEYGRQVEDVTTRIAGQNYQDERNRMLDALGYGQTETGQRIGAQTAGLGAQQGQQAQNLAERQAQTKELMDTLQAVALPRLIEQYGLDVGVQQYREQMNALLQLLGMEGTLATGSTVNVQPSSASGGILSGLVNAGGQVGAAYAGKA